MAIDRNSLVDYLRSLGFDPSFPARRRLWGLYDPSRTYTGSAAQNTALLEYLRLGSTAPTLRLTASLFNVGDEVRAVVESRGRTSISNGFGGQSMMAEPGATVTLGVVRFAGVFPMTVESGFQQTQGVLMAVPQSSRIAVGFVASPIEYTTLPAPIPLEAEDEGLLEKFFNAVDADVLKRALAAIWLDVIQVDRLSGLSLDVFFGLTVMLVPAAAGVRLAMWGWTGVGWVFDTLHSFVDKVVDETPGLTDDERSRLKVLMALPVALAKLGLDLRKLRGSKAICDQFELINNTADNFGIKLFNLEPSEDGPRIAGGMVRDAASKSIGFVCEITKRH